MAKIRGWPVVAAGWASVTPTIHGRTAPRPRTAAGDTVAIVRLRGQGVATVSDGYCPRAEPITRLTRSARDAESQLGSGAMCAVRRRCDGEHLRARSSAPR